MQIYIDVADSEASMEHYLNLDLASYKLCSKITFLSLSFIIFRIGVIPALRVDVKIHEVLSGIH